MPFPPPQRYSAAILMQEPRTSSTARSSQISTMPSQKWDEAGAIPSTAVSPSSASTTSTPPAISNPSVAERLSRKSPTTAWSSQTTYCGNKPSALRTARHQRFESGASPCFLAAFSTFAVIVAIEDRFTTIPSRHHVINGSRIQVSQRSRHVRTRTSQMPAARKMFK